MLQICLSACFDKHSSAHQLSTAQLANVLRTRQTAFGHEQKLYHASTILLYDESAWLHRICCTCMLDCYAMQSYATRPMVRVCLQASGYEGIVQAVCSHGGQFCCSRSMKQSVEVWVLLVRLAQLSTKHIITMYRAHTDSRTHTLRSMRHHMHPWRWSTAVESGSS